VLCGRLSRNWFGSLIKMSFTAVWFEIGHRQVVGFGPIRSSMGIPAGSLRGLYLFGAAASRLPGFYGEFVSSPPGPSHSEVSEWRQER
jgi:hypothetical protein